MPYFDFEKNVATIFDFIDRIISYFGNRFKFENAWFLAGGRYAK
jgi:hypothetical protein